MARKLPSPSPFALELNRVTSLAKEYNLIGDLKVQLTINLEHSAPELIELSSVNYERPPYEISRKLLFFIHIYRSHTVTQGFSLISCYINVCIKGNGYVC